MSWRNYTISCVVVAVLTASVILYVPGVAQTLEAQLLGFLAANASG